MISWYAKNKRSLPFRMTKDPYKIWLSEVMLQQTKVKTVLPYYTNWIKKLPTLESVSLSNFQIPFEDTPLLNKARAKLIGSRSGYWADGTQTDSLWFENDGVVNSVSMFGPTTGVNGADPVIEYDAKDLSITGQWYWKKINQMDHWSVVGHFGSDEKKLRGFNIIKEHIELLKTLQ